MIISSSTSLTELSESKLDSPWEIRKATNQFHRRSHPSIIGRDTDLSIWKQLGCDLQISFGIPHHCEISSLPLLLVRCPLPAFHAHGPSGSPAHAVPTTEQNTEDHGGSARRIFASSGLAPGTNLWRTRGWRGRGGGGGCPPSAALTTLSVAFAPCLFLR